MKSNFTKILALLLFSASVTQVHPLTENAATGYSIAGSVAVGIIAGGITYMSLKDSKLLDSDIEKILASIAVGAGVGGTAGLLIYYCWLAKLTPTGRLAIANHLINQINRDGLIAAGEDADAIFAYAANRYHVRWPLALAHEDYVEMLNQLSDAELLLRLAAPDTNDERVLAEINRVAPRVAPLVDTIQRQVRALQDHRHYAIQANLLEGHRREERIEEQAERRHREAILLQQQLLTEARVARHRN